MKKVLKWIGIALAGVVVLAVLAAVGLSIAGGRQLNKTRDVQAEDIPIPTDAAALARGKHLALGSALCSECHGQDLSGDLLFEEPGIATVYASNITGLGETHGDADLIRAIRHGVGTDGRELVIMPAELYINLSAEDLGAIVAYLKTVPRVGNDQPEPALPFLGRVMLAAGMFGGDVFPAEIIDHNQPFPAMPEIGANSEYGAYLAQLLCKHCHGDDLAGFQKTSDQPPAPNLTSGGELGEWSEADFVQVFRTPHANDHGPGNMPWKSFSRFDDDELKGLWMYLQSLPAKEAELE
jgi:mono/diheme cytochrome c family protein